MVVPPPFIPTSLLFPTPSPRCLPLFSPPFFLLSTIRPLEIYGLTCCMNIVNHEIVSWYLNIACVIALKSVESINTKRSKKTKLNF